jgi:hypothetical protein
MENSYILKGTEDEYLLVIRLKEEKQVYKIIDHLYSSKIELIKEVAAQLEKSLHDNGRDSSKARSKNTGKAAVSNNSKRRKTKDS